MLERFFQVERERDESLFWMVEVFEENQAEEKNKKNIGHVFGEERETQ